MNGFIESFKENIDKFMHMGVCMGATILDPLLALGLALGKEYGDYKAKDNHWCWQDLLADYVGIIFGLGLRYSIFGVFI